MAHLLWAPPLQLCCDTTPLRRHLNPGKIKMCAPRAAAAPKGLISMPTMEISLRTAPDLPKRLGVVAIYGRVMQPTSRRLLLAAAPGRPPLAADWSATNTARLAPLTAC